MTHGSYDVEVRHEGQLYCINIPHLALPICRSCGEKVFTETVDEQIDAALRMRFHLLTPEETRAAPDHLKLTPKDAAELPGRGRGVSLVE